MASPASWSQNRVWRYSSSATVAWSVDIADHTSDRRTSLRAVHLGPGTRALVTGSSRGIGRALAERLAARGATVGLAARSSRELEALADALPGEHVVLEVDVADRASVEAAVERFGRMDLVVANAGIATYEPFAEQPPERYEAMTN